MKAAQLNTHTKVFNKLCTGLSSLPISSGKWMFSWGCVLEIKQPTNDTQELLRMVDSITCSMQRHCWDHWRNSSLYENWYNFLRNMYYHSNTSSVTNSQQNNRSWFFLWVHSILRLIKLKVSTFHDSCLFHSLCLEKIIAKVYCTSGQNVVIIPVVHFKSSNDHPIIGQ